MDEATQYKIKQSAMINLNFTKGLITEEKRVEALAKVWDEQREKRPDLTKRQIFPVMNFDNID